MKLVTDSNDDADLQAIANFTYYNNKYYALSDDVFEGGDFPSDSFTEDSDSGTPSVVASVADMTTFNDALYVTDLPQLGGTLSIEKYDGSWSTADTESSVDPGVNMLEEYADKLYVTAEDRKVWHITKGDVLTTSGSGTLDLGLPDGWVITMLRAASNRLWIGCLNTEGTDGLVYEWDGESENTPTRVYELESGVMAGVIKDNVPYIVDSHGSLRAFNGASFVEVARLPVDRYLLANLDGELNSRWINQNGMVMADNKILLAIENTRGGNSSEVSPNLPSGIWEYTADTGLYHKYSPSTSDVGGTSISDYGQIKLDSIGALYYNNRKGSDTENGTILLGAELDDGTYGIFTNDTLDTTQKWGFFTTSKLFAESVADQWQKFYVIYKKFLDSDDKIVVKYKTTEDTPTEASITWSDTNTFTSTDDLSSYSVGDEVQVLEGTGSGKSAHITAISDNAGTYTVDLDETFTGATGSATVFLEKWIKAGEVTSTNNTKDQFMGLTIPSQSVSPWIRFKVCIQSTGENELYKMRVINKSLVLE